jgi:arginine-tRNA-protein transferase
VDDVSRNPIHASRTAALAALIEKRRPVPGLPFPCPYLPGREARHVSVLARPFSPGLYQSFMDLNFRRSGGIVYRPECEGCRECRMLRVPVAEFRPSRAQRRCLSRNADLIVTSAPPSISPEKVRLFRRYLEHRHDGAMEGSAEELETFVRSPLETVELEYRADGRLLAVGIADVEPEALSAVYCYFDPDEGRRALGVLNVLRLLEECRRRGAAHLYLGYYVADCGKMSYKADYRPFETLEEDGCWRRVEGARHGRRPSNPTAPAPLV